jgi:hypothetical protein
VVGQGCSISINATIANKGFHTEDFNVALYADESATMIGDEVIVQIENAPY